jgi:hypothetical protein
VGVNEVTGAALEQSPGSGGAAVYKKAMRKENMRGALALAGVFLLSMVAWGSAGDAAPRDWSAWKHRLPVRLAGLTAPVSEHLPIDVMFTLKAAECPNPKKEIRLIYRHADGREQEVPCQLSRLRVWNKGDPKAADPTLNGRITFVDVSGGRSSGTYFILYGNPGAPEPKYPTDLVVAGRGPAWTIANSRIRVELRKGDPVKPAILHDVFGDSGQIAAVTLLANPKVAITNKDHTLHWNPGILIPERGWSNAHAWDPPPEVELDAGPVFVEVRRRGPLPLIPEVELAITYRFFAGRDYVWYGARLTAMADIGIVSLRTNELVFDQGFFTRLGWGGKGEVSDRPLAEFSPVNKHGDILRLPAGAPFLAVYDPAKKVGLASVNVDYAVADPWGGRPDLYDHAFFVVNGEPLIGSGGLLFWFRSFLNYAPEWDRRQRFILSSGTVISEESLFHFFAPAASSPLAGVVDLDRAVRDLPKLDIQVGPYPFGPSPR